MNMTFQFSRTVGRFFFACVFCFALTLLSGCGRGSLATGAVPTLTPAEQADVDRYIAQHGRAAIPYYLSDPTSTVNADVALKYIKYFIAQGATVEDKDQNENTALHHAVKGHLEVVKFLVSKGADVNARNDCGDTPLDLARRTEIVEYLNSLGAESPSRVVIPEIRKFSDLKER